MKVLPEIPWRFSPRINSSSGYFFRNTSKYLFRTSGKKFLGSYYENSFMSFLHEFHWQLFQELLQKFIRYFLLGIPPGITSEGFVINTFKIVFFVEILSIFFSGMSFFWKSIRIFSRDFPNILAGFLRECLSFYSLFI